MASRLVETVMINVDDFADSFLTCGTCFTGYDTHERAAKLLPCSHAVCRACLDRILETQIQSSTFRCPICRETISVPSGGASAFPPAFIVNQLLDLLTTQRRDVVPKCRLHPSQELLFCETCDTVFCTDCHGGRSHTSGHPPCALDSDRNGGGSTSGDPYDDVDSDTMTSSTSAGMMGGVGSSLNHNVISFNVAIKRCTEIMLYKMQLCVQELDRAEEAVSAELGRLTVNKDLCMESINTKFAEIIALVERRQAELLHSVKHLTEEKNRALTDQLTLISSERDTVRRECNRLKGILDVRSISKAINYLNDKLDTVASLTEPRENAFLRYQDGMSQLPMRRNGLESTMRKPCLSTVLLGCTGDASSNITTAISLNVDEADETRSIITQSSTLQPSTPNINPTDLLLAPSSSSAMVPSNLIDIAHCLAAFGRILVSTTYPALCTVRLPSQLVVYLTTKSILRAVDYHGRPQSTGGTDPIEVTLTDAEGRSVPTELYDKGDGTYDLLLRPLSSGLHQLSVQILSRPIRGSPFSMQVRRAQSRGWCFSEDADGRSLIQPFAVAYGHYPVTTGSANPSLYDPNPICYVYLLDTGNSRLLVLNPDSGAVHTTLVGEALAGQAATGIAWSPDGLWIVNWRAKRIYLLDPRTDEVVQSIESPHFVEPTSACLCPLTGNLYVADNGAGCVFQCDPSSCTVRPFVGAGVKKRAGTGQLISPSPTPSSIHSPPSSPCDSGSHERARLSAPVDSSLSSLPLSEPRSFRRISGLCATASGELVISSGSTVRIFSADGLQLNTLTAPVPPELDRKHNTPSGQSIHAAAAAARNPASTSASLRRCDPQPDRNEPFDRRSLNHDPLTPESARFSLSSPLRSAVGTSQQSSMGAFPARGQFGGVCVTHPNPTDNLGYCLLASYSDRRRSGIVVWPQATWLPDSTVSTQLTRSHPPSRPMSTPHALHEPPCDRNGTLRVTSCDLSDACPETPSTSTTPSSILSSSCVDNCTNPYLIEAEPGLRRLAGLVSLTTTRHLVVVDQGAQSLSRLRYV